MVLLITGCIHVAMGTKYVKIVDEKERLQDYKKTILWAIHSSPFTKIVFCENSNYIFDTKKFSAEAIKCKKSFEYITFKGNTEKILKQGKGYGEGEIIQYAINNSEILKKETDFYKITGRLRIKNIENIVNKQRRGECCFNESLFDKDAYDTRFYYCEKIFFVKELMNEYKKVDDDSGNGIEKIYYDKMKQDNIRPKGFYYYPQFQGKSGTAGFSYEKEPPIIQS